MGIRTASALALLIGACATFASSESPLADGGRDASSSSDGAGLADAPEGTDGATSDSATDAGVDADSAPPFCVVKPGIGCETGCPQRCPPNVNPATNDVLEVLTNDAGVGVINRTDCHRYQCVYSIGFDAGFCTMPPIGLRVRVCSTSNPSLCPVGSTFSLALGGEFDCSSNSCTYGCERVLD